MNSSAEEMVAVALVLVAFLAICFFARLAYRKRHQSKESRIVFAVI